MPELTDGIADTVVPMRRAFVPRALHSVVGLPTVCACNRLIELDADGADRRTDDGRADLPVLVCRQSSVRRRQACVSATRLRNITPAADVRAGLAY